MFMSIKVEVLFENIHFHGEFLGEMTTILKYTELDLIFILHSISSTIGI